MATQFNFHLSDRAAFKAGALELDHGTVRILDLRDGAGNELTVYFKSDDQARELAATILAALYPETAALAEAHAEPVQ